MKALAEVVDLVREASGLDAATLGEGAVEAAVRQRMQAHGDADGERYLCRLRDGAVELRALLEALVVVESWFFRDAEAFAAVARDAQAAFDRGRTAPLRLLSAACAGGEEPFSLAMSLIDAGLTPQQFTVEAFDISAAALARARHGVYRRNAFRGEAALRCRERYFTAQGEGWAIDDALRHTVRLHAMSLFDAPARLGLGDFDAVFCRNLLIYFDAPTQRDAVARLGDLLAAAGRLYVGPAEGGLLLELGWRSTGVPLAFGFERATPRTASAPPAAAAPATRAAAKRPRPRPRPPALPLPQAMPAVAEVAGSLREIVALADGGALSALREACERHLREHGASAEVYCYLGLACDASGAPAEAEAAYRRALYLDPGHEQALLHLSLLLEAAGDRGAAKGLRERAKRLQAKAAHR